jgi:tetratricopeptide (TPR) repeat protein
MAYEPPATALHHLKMAKAYLDDYRGYVDDAPDAFSSIGPHISAILERAAEHLKKARAIDPAEVLWVEDAKENVKYKYTQDFLASEALCYEGNMLLNNAKYIESKYNDSEGKINRGKRAQGIQFLERAREVLLKSLTYNSVNSDALLYLGLAYLYLGDGDSYRSVLERRLKLDPDNILLHKAFETANEPGGYEPLFSNPPIISLNAALALSIFSGFIIFGVGAANRIAPFAPIGLLLFFGPIAYWWFKRKLD